MRSFVKRYGKSIYSQNGEDGILEECVKRMNISMPLLVEFGAADGEYLSNTKNLFKKGGIRLLFDINPGSDIVTPVEITTGNVNDRLPLNIDVLSIDIDGNDYEVWKAYKGISKIVIIEINSDISPTERVYNKGTSYLPMVELGLSKGYFLLCHTGNLIFILNEYKNLFPELTLDPIKEVEEYFDYSWLKELV